MSQDTPKYFYIAHIHISHPILLQKIVDQVKLFKNHDPNCQIARTDPSNGFLTLIVTSQRPIATKAIANFEQSVPFINGVVVLFTHKTTDADKNGEEFPPTFVYSAYYSLSFSQVSLLFGKGTRYEKSLRKILGSIKGGSYYLYVSPSFMSLVLETTKPFNPNELDKLFTKIEVGLPCVLTSFSNLPSTPAS